VAATEAGVKIAGSGIFRRHERRLAAMLDAGEPRLAGVMARDLAAPSDVVLFDRTAAVASPMCG
jgi:hypothetical protein